MWWINDRTMINWKSSHLHMHELLSHLARENKVLRADDLHVASRGRPVTSQGSTKPWSWRAIHASNLLPVSCK